MALHPTDRFDKTKYRSAGQMARLSAEGKAEQFNEPAYVLEGPDEFIVVRGIAWDYRAEWGSEGWPKWAKSDPDSKVVEVVTPKDMLAGKYAEAEKLVKKMQETVRLVRYDQAFDLEEMFRDYGDVRLMLSLVRSAAEHLDSVVTHLSFEVNKAVTAHKETHPEVAS
jgi:hypothetical protein